PASDNKPAAPSTGTAFAPRLRFGACFAFDIVKSSRSGMMWVGIDYVSTASATIVRLGRALSKAYQAEFADDIRVRFRSWGPSASPVASFRWATHGRITASFAC